MPATVLSLFYAILCKNVHNSVIDGVEYLSNCVNAVSTVECPRGARLEQTVADWSRLLIVP